MSLFASINEFMRANRRPAPEEPQPARREAESHTQQIARLQRELGEANRRQDAAAAARLSSELEGLL